MPSSYAIQHHSRDLAIQVGAGANIQHACRQAADGDICAGRTHYSYLSDNVLVDLFTAQHYEPVRIAHLP